MSLAAQGEDAPGRDARLIHAALFGQAMQQRDGQQARGDKPDSAYVKADQGDFSAHVGRSFIFRLVYLVVWFTPEWNGHSAV
jgi:hypothetical protein